MEQALALREKVGFVAIGAEEGKLNWVTIANLKSTALSLVGWTLKCDATGTTETQRLTGIIEPGETKRIESTLKLTETGVVNLNNGANEVIDKFEFKKCDVNTCAVRCESKLQIFSAMINAVGDEFENEFAILANFSSIPINLAGYRLSDGKHAPLPLSGVLLPGESTRLNKMYDQGTGIGVTLNNRRGVITLSAPSGAVVDEVEYADHREARIEEGVPVSFHLDWSKTAVVKFSVSEVNARSLTLPNSEEDEKHALYDTPLRFLVPALVVALALCKICKAYKRRSRA